VITPYNPFPDQGKWRSNNFSSFPVHFRGPIAIARVGASRHTLPQDSAGPAPTRSRPLPRPRPGGLVGESVTRRASVGGRDGAVPAGAGRRVARRAADSRRAGPGAGRAARRDPVAAVAGAGRAAGVAAELLRHL